MDKPIIGIIGGIGSGKSYVSSLFAELGALVISADDCVRIVYERDDVRQALKSWWGDEVLSADGSAVNRKAVATRVFTDEGERRRLEQLVHPLVHEVRRQIMGRAEDDPSVTAYIWDTPLLVETGLHRECDAVVFVDAPLEVRLERVRRRGWDAAELARREKSQLPLDTKRQISDYVISNAADAAAAPDQIRNAVRQVYSRITAKISQRN